jgi:hypothetical protein
MPKFLNPITLATTGFAIAAGCALFAFVGQAEAASRKLCETSDLRRTTSCCEAYIRDASEHWGNSSGVSCNAGTVVCKGGSRQAPSTLAGVPSRKVCYVVLRKKPKDYEGKDTQNRTQDTPSRDNPNGGQTGGNTKL